MSPGVPVHPHAQPWGATGWAAPPAAPSRGRRTGLWLVLASSALLCLVGAAAIGWWAVDRGPDHPDEWDPVVAELVDFVETERHSEFDHPVYVDFLDAEQYRSLAGAGPDRSVDDAEAAAVDEAADDEMALYRSLGLISGAPDLSAANESLMGDGTAAFYDPAEDRIVVRGLPVDGALPLDLQITVVHELAHALQHQVLDRRGEDPPETTEGSDALVAVLEGDASLVERAFFEQLDPAQQDELEAAEAALGVEAATALTDASVPEVLATMFSMPYAFGPSWVEIALEGPDGVDLATMLGSPRPTTADVLGLVPLDEVDAAVEVAEPDIPDDAEVLYVDTWGAFSWAVAFASWVEPDLGAAAVDAWAGDTVVVYVDGSDRVCFEASVRASTAEGAAAFGDAARGWVDQLPEQSEASADVDGESVSVRSCDPGAEVEFSPSHDATVTLGLMALENSITANGVVEGVEVDAANCFAEGLISAFGADRLADHELVESPEFGQVRAELLDRCGI